MSSAQVAVEGLIDIHCKELRLPGIKSAYRELAREALNNGIEPSQFLLTCLEHEAESRRQNRLRGNMRAAKFGAIKTLAQFDFSHISSVPKAKVLSLADGHYIRQRENVLCLGPSGTGKSHIAVALGVAAIECGYRVKFIRAVTLVQELLQAQQEVRLNRYLKTWQKIDLAICDEMGYMELGPGAPLLFQFVSERYESGSTILTSNLDFARWQEVLGDAALTTALIDRLTHRCHILVFKGDSYRFRESSRRHKEVSLQQT